MHPMSTNTIPLCTYQSHLHHVRAEIPSISYSVIVNAHNMHLNAPDMTLIWTKWFILRHLDPILEVNHMPVRGFRAYKVVYLG